VGIRTKLVAVIAASAVVVSVLVGAPHSASALVFEPGTGPNDTVEDFVVLPDGSLVIAGTFTEVDGTPRPYLARLNADGSLDTSFNASVNGAVYDVDLLDDGSLLIAGEFTQAGGDGRVRVAKLEANGVANGDFKTTAGANGPVYDAEVTSTGGVVIGGSFASVRGNTRNNLALLDDGGGVDGSFNPNVNGLVREVVLDDTGRVLIGGDFTEVAGSARGRVDRLLASGAPDTSWTPGSGASDSVFTMAVDDDGTVVIGGSFTTVDGATNQGIARLGATGAPKEGFSTGGGFNSVVRDVAFDGDGNILAAGGFVNFDLTESIRVSRLFPTGTLDPSFSVGSGPDGLVLGVAPAAAGGVFIAGAFEGVDGDTSTRVALLTADGRLAGTAAARPGPNSDVTLIRDNGFVDVSWVGTTDPGVQPVAGYIVKMRSASAASWSAATGACAQAFTAISIFPDCRLTGLTAGETYYVSVAARSNWGVGAAAVSASFVFATAPSAVVPTVTPLDGGVRVDWSPPVSTGGEPIIQYEATLLGGPEPGVPAPCSTDGAGRTCTISGAENDRLYLVVVTASNGIGISTSVAVPVTPNPVPTQPGRPNASAGFTGVGDEKAVYVGFDNAEPTDGVVSWTFTASPDGGSCTATLPARSCLIPIADTSVRQTVSAVANNPSGSSAATLSRYSVLADVCGAGSSPFSAADVPPGRYFYRDVLCMFELGVTTSIPYSPEGGVTRAQMAKFLWTMAGSPSAPSSCGFNDEASIPSWARQGACWMKEVGITEANPYKPNDQVTRGQMAGFLWRFAGRPEASSSCGFLDEPSIPTWARAGACWMSEYGITNINPYRAVDAVKRGEMAAFLSRLGGSIGLWIPVVES
jgi:uncharacterized delta-60 repeat protein